LNSLKEAARVCRFPKFSCHTIRERRINDGSVNGFLPVRDDLLGLARVGNAVTAFFFSAFVRVNQNKLKKTQLCSRNFSKSSADYPRC
jgi:hypothetical protein